MALLPIKASRFQDSSFEHFHCTLRQCSSRVHHGEAVCSTEVWNTLDQVDRFSDLIAFDWNVPLTQRGFLFFSFLKKSEF